VRCPYSSELIQKKQLFLITLRSVDDREPP
jgi:hypothetical protein